MIQNHDAPIWCVGLVHEQYYLFSLTEGNEMDDEFVDDGSEYAVAWKRFWELNSLVNRRSEDDRLAYLELGQRIGFEELVKFVRETYLPRHDIYLVPPPPEKLGYANLLRAILRNDLAREIHNGDQRANDLIYRYSRNTPSSLADVKAYFSMDFTEVIRTHTMPVWPEDVEEMFRPRHPEDNLGWKVVVDWYGLDGRRPKSVWAIADEFRTTAAAIATLRNRFVGFFSGQSGRIGRYVSNRYSWLTDPLCWRSDEFAAESEYIRLMIGERILARIAKDPVHHNLDALVCDPILFRPVDELDLTVRTGNCLRSYGIYFVGELVNSYLPEELLRIKNFGDKSLREITSVLNALNLTLRMNLSPEVRLALRLRHEDL